VFFLKRFYLQKIIILGAKVMNNKQIKKSPPVDFSTSGEGLYILFSISYSGAE